MTTLGYDGPSSIESRTGRDYSGCFLLNNWGMGRMNRCMYRAGVLDIIEPPGFPKYPGEQHFADGGEFAQPIDDVGREFSDARAAVLEHRLDNGKVPVFKFNSTDGWIVTRDECRVIATGLRQLVVGPDWPTPDRETDDERFWRNLILDFADFCERSADHGHGFVVF